MHFISLLIINIGICMLQTVIVCSNITNQLNLIYIILFDIKDVRSIKYVTLSYDNPSIVTYKEQLLEGS